MGLLLPNLMLCQLWYLVWYPLHGDHLLFLSVLKDDEVNEKALWKKIKVLCFQGSFHDAHNLATDWIQKDPEVNNDWFL